MGNQPSAPSSPQSTQPSSPPSPPLPPPCDFNCQRQKQLDGLKTALDTATDNKDTNPEAYEQARIAYYTLLNGQTWLVGEKDRIAEEEIAPVITNYSNQFKELKDKKKQQTIFVNLSSALTAQQKEDENEVKFLNTQVGKYINDTDLLNRLSQLKNVAQPEYDWLHYLLYGIIGLLGVYTLYLLLTKAMSYIFPSQQTLVGGKKQKLEHR
jgi:hypothetical protein